NSTGLWDDLVADVGGELSQAASRRIHELKRIQLYPELATRLRSAAFGANRAMDEAERLCKERPAAIAHRRQPLLGGRIAQRPRERNSSAAVAPFGRTVHRSQRADAHRSLSPRKIPAAGRRQLVAIRRQGGVQHPLRRRPRRDSHTAERSLPRCAAKISRLKQLNVQRPTLVTDQRSTSNVQLPTSNTYARNQEAFS